MTCDIHMEVKVCVYMFICVWVCMIPCGGQEITQVSICRCIPQFILYSISHRPGTFQVTQASGHVLLGPTCSQCSETNLEKSVIFLLLTVKSKPSLLLNTSHNLDKDFKTTEGRGKSIDDLCVYWSYNWHGTSLNSSRIWEMKSRYLVQGGRQKRLRFTVGK